MATFNDKGAVLCPPWELVEYDPDIERHVFMDHVNGYWLRWNQVSNYCVVGDGEGILYTTNGEACLEMAITYWRTRLAYQPKPAATPEERKSYGDF